ncbi:MULTISPECIES: DUF7507 domain-containing protein [Pseudofrankia]|uniref:DUF7507 domain-containing protein n=1 Tax=Pseudofrankia TaxID=2994363 RepID=UPI001E3CB37E|nr:MULTISPECIES: hypothetical protein [Pseudofrankia]
MRRWATGLLATVACAGAAGIGAPGAVAAPTAPAPALSMAMSPLAVSFASAGIELPFYYTITNTGGQTLTRLTVHNSLPRITTNLCLEETLAAGQTTNCLAVYTTTEADVTRGGVTNAAIASAVPPTGPAVTSSRSSVTIPALAAPAVALFKSSFDYTFSEAGQLVSYIYRVANTGNAPLTGVTVHDPHPGLSPLGCQETTIAPGAATFCFARYTTTAADVAAGEVTDTATATATPPTGPAVTSNPASRTIRTPRPWLGLTTSVAPAHYSAGTTLRFTYIVENSGNVVLNDVTVTDTLPGLSPVACPSTRLRTGESMTCTATYTASPADVARGSVTNSATAVGTAAKGGGRPTAGPATATAFAAGPATPGTRPSQPLTFLVPVPFPLPVG